MLAIIAAVGVAVLSHLAPFPFLLDTTKHTIWRMPRNGAPTVYLTFDDGPNPIATPMILDALARHDVRATFFVIDKHLTPTGADRCAARRLKDTPWRCTGIRASRWSKVRPTWRRCFRKPPPGWRC